MTTGTASGRLELESSDYNRKDLEFIADLIQQALEKREIPVNSFSWSIQVEYDAATEDDGEDSA